MIDALISGKLIKDPVRKVGQSGKPFCNFMLQVSQYDSEETCLFGGIAFGECAEKIARLAKDDPLMVVGQVKLAEWTGSDGSPKVGLNITVSDCLTVYQVAKRRGTDKPKQSTVSQGYKDGFDDDIPI